MALREELIASAAEILGSRMLTEDSSCGGVAAALITENGNIYRGICLDAPCSLGFCAEQGARAGLLQLLQYMRMAGFSLHAEDAGSYCIRSIMRIFRQRFSSRKEELNSAICFPVSGTDGASSDISCNDSNICEYMSKIGVKKI